MNTRRKFFDTPPLKYVGSKWMLADWIVGAFPRHDIYVEPYCGAAAVFFRKFASRIEVLNDLDGEVINFFRVLRSDRDALLEQIRLTPFSREEYEIAISFKKDLSDIERARRFYVASWQSFGSTLIYRSGFRTYNKADGRSSLTAHWKREDGLLDAANRLRDAVIENIDAIDCIQRYDGKKTLFYVDPPYVLSSRSQGGRRRYRCEMTNDEHESLLDALLGCKAHVVVSGYDNPLYHERLKGWQVLRKSTTTNGNQKSVECLWVSPRAASMSSLPLFKKVQA